MPTYSYACTKCENKFDIVQSFTDDSLTVCEDCGGRLRKLFSAVGIVFKGSGFYRTDSRAGAVPSGSSSSESSSESSSDSGSSSSSSESSAPAPKADKPAKTTPATSS